MTQYLAQYDGLERKLSKGLEMSQKQTLLAITLEPLEVGGWISGPLCEYKQGTLCVNFKLLLLLVLKISLFLCS